MRQLVVKGLAHGMSGWLRLHAVDVGLELMNLGFVSLQSSTASVFAPVPSARLQPQCGRLAAAVHDIAEPPPARRHRLAAGRLIDGELAVAAAQVLPIIDHTAEYGPRANIQLVQRAQGTLRAGRRSIAALQGSWG